jgi:hypothetical protein
LNPFCRSCGQVCAEEGGSRSLLGFSGGGKKGHKNNQAAQAIDQSKFFGGGINQGQAGEVYSEVVTKITKTISRQTAGVKAHLGFELF